jgi:hypothetical protein
VPRQRPPQNGGGTRPQGEQGTEEERIVATSALGLGLTLKQARFVSALLEQVLGEKPKAIDPTAAALAMGVPPDRARAWARLMLDAEPVRQALHAQLRAQIEAGAATPTRWLAEVARLALVDPDLRDYYDDRGTLKPIKEWTAEMSAHVSELRSEEVWAGQGEERRFVGYNRTVKFHPRTIKTAALEMLAKYHKLITQTLELTGKDGTELFPVDGATADERARIRREQLLQTIGPLTIPVLDNALH